MDEGGGRGRVCLSGHSVESVTAMCLYNPPFFSYNVRVKVAMSFRTKAGSATSATPPAPAAPRLAKVLQAGLSVQAKYVDSDGKTVKYSEFEPEDPKQVYSRDCLSVPWSLFDEKNPMRVAKYIDDVKADPRLKEVDGVPPNITYAVSEVQSSTIQAYANLMNNSRVVKIAPSDTKWVVVWKTELVRFCLVPIDSISLDARLEEAVEFLERYMDDDALTNWKKRRPELYGDELLPPVDPAIDPSYATFRDYYVGLFKELLENIKEQAAGKRARS